MACSYCYARRMYKRFRWNPEIVWDEKCLIDLRKIKEPSRIFVGSTIELFGEWVTDETIKYILKYCQDYPQHTFIFLTKQPWYLPGEFPDNCWIGASVTNQEMFSDALSNLDGIKAPVRFISFEPLLEEVINDNRDGGFCNLLSFYFINWLIIGQQTPVSIKTMPKIGWVKEIIQAADKAGVPVFLKNNLLPIFKEDIEADGYNQLFFSGTNLRQEFPKG